MDENNEYNFHSPGAPALTSSNNVVEVAATHKKCDTKDKGKKQPAVVTSAPVDDATTIDASTHLKQLLTLWKDTEFISVEDPFVVEDMNTIKSMKQVFTICVGSF